MNVSLMNRRLAQSGGATAGLFPHLEDLKRLPYVFRMEFGLAALPRESGVLVVRGPRQYGKSTWLEQQLAGTIRDFGPGSAFYLNGDELVDARALREAIRELVPLFRADAPVHRLFIDEITAVSGWAKALKSVLDSGDLRRVLVVTTGSKAADLRHGDERLPGRKGNLDRTAYWFTPVAYREFRRVCEKDLGAKTVTAYLMSGGSPIACAQIAQGRMPEHVIQTVKDWVYGDCAYSGRSRSSLMAVMECLIRHGGTPLGQAKLARETGLANNTVALGYLNLMADLMCVASSYAWDSSRQIHLRQKPCKFHFCNTLVVLAWHPAQIRTVAELESLDASAKGKWLEWAVAQELWRRAAIRGEEFPEEMAHWQSQTHELDFVMAHSQFLEVKAGPTSPLEFAWFNRVFPRGELKVVSQSKFKTQQITAVTMEEFLQEE